VIASVSVFRPPVQLPGGALLAGDPGVLDMGVVDVDVIHGGDDPGVAEDLLDRGQVYPVRIQLAGAVVPQEVRGDASPPVRQVRRGSPGERGPRASSPTRAQVPSGFLP
jgi:hypothetical protein